MMRLKTGAALLALAISAAAAEAQVARAPQPLTQPPHQNRPAPAAGKCSLATCINQGLTLGYSHTAALNWCQANKNGC